MDEKRFPPKEDWENTPPSVRRMFLELSREHELLMQFFIQSHSAARNTYSELKELESFKQAQKSNYASLKEVDKSHQSLPSPKRTSLSIGLPSGYRKASEIFVVIMFLIGIVACILYLVSK